jgi:hypothetical protein
MTRVAAVVGDLGLVLLLVMVAPFAILLIGAPLALFVRLLIEIGGRL